jgi:hypothetical protein
MLTNVAVACMLMYFFTVIVLARKTIILAIPAALALYAAPGLTMANG